MSGRTLHFFTQGVNILITYENCGLLAQDLDDSFLRVACGTEEDNMAVYEALKEINDKL